MVASENATWRIIYDIIMNYDIVLQLEELFMTSQEWKG